MIKKRKKPFSFFLNVVLFLVWFCFYFEILIVNRKQEKKKRKTKDGKKTHGKIEKKSKSQRK